MIIWYLSIKGERKERNGREEDKIRITWINSIFLSCNFFEISYEEDYFLFLAKRGQSVRETSNAKCGYVGANTAETRSLGSLPATPHLIQWAAMTGQKEKCIVQFWVWIPVLPVSPQWHDFVQVINSLCKRYKLPATRQISHGDVTYGKVTIVNDVLIFKLLWE